MSSAPPARSAVRAVAAGGAAGAGVLALGGLATSAYFARAVLTPDHRRPDDTRVLAVGPDWVALDRTPETTVPGRYGLWFGEEGGEGHARVGEVLEQDDHAVVRRLVTTDRGTLAPGGARWDQYWFWDSPRVSLGVSHRDVAVDGELGPLPSWLVEPDPAAHAGARAGARAGASDAGAPGAGRWAVLVHGRGARREECLRAVPVLRRLGYTCLVVSYRNDVGAPPAPDGRYNLGLSEWRDLEAAMAFALAHGATGLVLGGWSMGGAIVLQTLDRSPLAEHVDAVLLDSPVVDWGDVLAHHARLHHIPAPLRMVGTGLMGRRAGRRLVGVHDPVDVALTDWVARAAELHHRVLLQASDDDEFVPVGPALALAQARPDLITLERWTTARHCKEWNLDPERWERAVERFLTGAPVSGGRPAATAP